MNLVEEEMPSPSDANKADFIELEEIAKSTEDLISRLNNQQSQTDDLGMDLYFLSGGGGLPFP